MKRNLIAAFRKYVLLLYPENKILEPYDTLLYLTIEELGRTIFSGHFIYIFRRAFKIKINVWEMFPTSHDPSPILYTVCLKEGVKK